MVPESKRRLFMIAAIVLFLLFSVGLARDLLLGRSDDAPAPEIPTVIVEGLDVVRQEKGGDWYMRAERAQKKENLSEAENIDVHIRSKAGSLWDITAPRGMIFESSGEVRLFEVLGHISHPSGELDWSAPTAEWDDGDSVWRLPEGLEARDDRLVLEGSRGWITMSGSVVVEEGAVVTWQGKTR